ncbi:hypothetical protein D9615_006902 [Tricholomella constricta]|uniref:Lariat debranching enzyme C-terminal domain-containing protein n=1 Tax=Tricholomella constricta TaxID=117010 RepID=A0A8H5M310_9AGAR|nr:hypothetical protein D9615_006902 [Tricholomella constricta]
MPSTLQIELADSKGLTPRFANCHHILCGPILMQLDEPTDGTVAGAKQMKAKILALLNDSRSVVFRAELDSGLAIVLKFSADEDSPAVLCEEAAVYTECLKTLQGSIVPTYYGKYSARCPHGRNMVCIVLEDCGEEIGRDLDELENKEKYKILEKLGEFHLGSNYHLGDFGDHNVLVKNGEYRIIGFRREDMWYHECKFDNNWRFGEDYKTTYTCGLLANVEIPLQININGRDHACTWYPSQKVIDTLLEEDGRLTIAVEGCCHGDLDAIYAHIAQLEAKHQYKVDLLLICGDFQAVRDWADLQCMAVPDKYKELKDFHKYYSGAKTAPILTIVIGGNHEASNYMWELYHGGWLAPNIYFLGHAGSILVNGIRIAGASGIFKVQDFRQGHHERMPYDNSAMRSIYHIREYCVRKLSLLPAPEVFLSHDWPHQIEHHGDLRGLLSRKKFLRADIDTGRLGSPPLMGLLTTLRPQWWFAAHLHTRFEATVAHYDADGSGAGATDASVVAMRVENPDEIVIDDEDVGVTEVSVVPKEDKAHRNPDGITLSDEEEDVAAPPLPPAAPPAPVPTSVTNFLALDKCLPNRQFLEVIDIPTPQPTGAQGVTDASSSSPPTLSYDPVWLAITRAFHPNLSLNRMQSAFPEETHARSLVARELEWVNTHVPPKLGGTWAVQGCQNFVMTAPPTQPDETGKKGGRIPQPPWYTNPQTEAFCAMLEIPNKINPPPKGVPKAAPPATTSAPPPTASIS